MYLFASHFTRSDSHKDESQLQQRELQQRYLGSQQGTRSAEEDVLFLPAPQLRYAAHSFHSRLPCLSVSFVDQAHMEEDLPDGLLGPGQAVYESASHGYHLVVSHVVALCLAPNVEATTTTTRSMTSFLSRSR